MNDCTRPSHSFCLSDKSKSLGRSSPRLKPFEPDCPPAPPPPQEPDQAFVAPCPGLSDHAHLCGNRRGLTFPVLQTIVSYKRLKGNSLGSRHSGATQRVEPGIWRSWRRRFRVRDFVAPWNDEKAESHGERSDPVRHSRRRRAALCRS